MTLWRGCVCGLAAAEKKTVPLPLPVAPAVIANHDAPVDADHTQPAGAVTVADAVLPVAATDVLPGETTYEQGVAAAD